MKNTDDKAAEDFQRQKAEDLLMKTHKESYSNLSEYEMRKVIHELEVHQVELEIQNDELRHLWAKAEVVNDKYTGLYDFTPTGYFMLSREGKITELNLSGANMLSKDRRRLKFSQFGFFVADDSKPDFNLFLEKVFDSKTKENCEVALTTDGNQPIFVHLTGIVTENGEQSLVTVVDITERKRAENLLEQTRHNYETFFNTIDVFLFVLDQDGNIMHVNTTVINRLGYSWDELAGKPVLMLHPPERREEAGRIVGEMLNGITTFCPVPIVTKTGILIPVETRVSHGSWDGRPVIFGVTKDISQVQLSEEKFSKLFYINPSACGLSDLDTHAYIEVNEAFSTLFGFEKSEVIGKTAMELGILAPDAADAILAKAQSNGSTTNIETILTAKNGERKHVLLSSENIYIQDKKYRYTVVHDITDRTHAEEALRESEEKYRSLIQYSSDPIFSFNPDGTYKFVNEAFAKPFGVMPEDLVGKTPHFIFSFEEAEKRLAVVRQVLQTGQKGEIEVKVVTQSGEELYYLSMLDPIKDDEGKVLFVTCIAKDITDRMKAEISLKMKSEELQQFNNLMVGREMRMVELKQEVNALLRKQGSEERYTIFGA